MDKDRQIRFLYPPLVFVGFWVWAVYLDAGRSLRDYLPVNPSSGMSTGELAGIVAGGGVAVLVAGFLISVLSVVALRLAFLIGGHSMYEAVWSDQCRKRVAILIGQPSTSKHEVLYLAAIFDHLLLPDRIHTWLFRRWSSFNLTCHSCVALLLVLVVTLWGGVSPGRAWYVTWLLSVAVLATQAVFSWRDTMGMVEFYSKLQPEFLQLPIPPQTPNQPPQPTSGGEF